MSNNLTTSSPNLGGLSKQSTGSFLEKAMQELPTDAQERLAEVALNKQLEIEAEERKAQGRHNASSADMIEFDRNLRNLQTSAGSADYSVEGNFGTASGTTKIKVTQNNKTMLIVGLVVVGVIVLFFLGG